MVCEPTVSHSFAMPPASTFRLIAAGAFALPPLWPGSSRTVRPRIRSGLAAAPAPAVVGSDGDAAAPDIPSGGGGGSERTA